MQSITIRAATQEDAPAFRRVFELASEGIAPWVWAQSVEPGGDIDAYGNTRMADKIANAAPGCCFVAEVDGQAAGGIITYDIGDEPEQIDDDTPPVFVPMIELENAAPNTHYINALAVFPGFQGRGIGRQLMHAVAGNAQKNGLSLVAEDANPRALALYASEGFVEAARRPVVEAKGLSIPGDNWILLIKPNN